MDSSYSCNRKRVKAAALGASQITGTPLQNTPATRQRTTDLSRGEFIHTAPAEQDRIRTTKGMVWEEQCMGGL